MFIKTAELVKRYIPYHHMLKWADWRRQEIASYFQEAEEEAMVWILGSAEEPVLTATLSPPVVLVLVVVVDRPNRPTADRLLLYKLEDEMGWSTTFKLLSY